VLDGRIGRRSDGYRTEVMLIKVNLRVIGVLEERSEEGVGGRRPPVGVPGRHVLCAALLGRLARAAMLPASSTVDSSLDPSPPWIRHRA